MQTPLVSAELLQKSDKILFVTHLALGDFTYLQSFFKAFALAHPHIKIHIWVDELRRTRCFWRWKHLKAYALYDWLEACPFIHKVYRQTYAPHLLKRSCKEARAERYPIVVSLATLRPHYYARLARKLSPYGFVVGVGGASAWWQLSHKLAYKKLDALFPAKPSSAQGKHISAVYAAWFEQVFGLRLDEREYFPVISIPNKWTVFAKLRFMKWGIGKRNRPFGKVFFINAFAKTDKRCWPMVRVIELVSALKKNDIWGDSYFIINVVPEEAEVTQRFFAKHSLNNTILVSAQQNFFQLPAIMAECDLVISVETAVMHLANAVRVPVIALMRQKNPEWAPIDTANSTIITTKRRSDWVKAITAADVMQAFKSLKF